MNKEMIKRSPAITLYKCVSDLISNVITYLARPDLAPTSIPVALSTKGVVGLDPSTAERITKKASINIIERTFR
jgi:hypothetical protein